MNYELAKRLKDAGFPQHTESSICGLDELPIKPRGRHVVLKTPSVGISTRPQPIVYIPLLSELIEACGEQFFRLSHSSNTDETYWDAESWNTGEIETGSTPEEAVAKLWLALNEK